MTTEKKELVVLLHGIRLIDSSTSLSEKFQRFMGRYGLGDYNPTKPMKAVDRFMRKQGYETLNIAYPSTKMSLEELADFLHERLELAGAFNRASKIHFVTHSMGGLLTRYYIHKYKPKNLGRVVMAGTPNNGSEFADFLSENPYLKELFRLVCGPAGSQLRVAHQHDPDMKIDYDVGVIAGSQSINPLAPFILPEGHDGTVAIESTHIDGMKDHIIVNANHTFMMYTRVVQEQALHFIKHGEFKHGPA